MKTTASIPDQQDGNPVNILLIGNNPIEMSRIYDQLKRATGVRFITNIAFSLSDGIAKAVSTKPSCILVDDAMEDRHISDFTRSLTDDTRTSDIPVALLKSSNYTSISASGIQEYLLKEYLDADRLTKSIRNILKYKRMRLILYKSYKVSKRKIKQLGF